MKNKDFNLSKEQKDYLRVKTCYILDCNNYLQEDLKRKNIPKEIIKEIEKALNIFFEINQICCKENKNEE